VLVTWGVWLVGWLVLRTVSLDFGIALPISTSTAIALSRYLGFVIAALLLSPPIALTILWWRRTRRSAPS
jgi:hypothetical protein